MYENQNIQKSGVFSLDRVINQVCSFVLALCPLLQHYKGFLKNAGFSALLLICPFIFSKLLVKLRTFHSLRKRSCFIPLIFFIIWKSVIHNISVMKVFYGLFMSLLIIAIIYDCIDITFFLKCTVTISCLTCIAIVFQYIFHYCFHKHICLVPVSLLLPESANWIPGVTTGLIDIKGKANGFYRPAAFFLEPSHLFLYCFPNLCCQLLSKTFSKKKLENCVLISLAIILSTSGMGIAVVGGIWVVFLCLYNNKNRKASLSTFLRLENFIAVIILLLCLFASYFSIGFIHNAVNRVFSSSTGSTAISGRVNRALNLVKGMNATQYLLGVTDDVSNIDFNLSGFFATLYEFGLIGLLFSYSFYLRCLFSSKNDCFWLSFIILIISFFTAHTHGTFYLLYFTLILSKEICNTSLHEVKKDFLYGKKKFRG